MPELKKTILEAIQAILPVTLAVVVLQLVFVKMPTPLFLQFLISAFMAAVGMSLFLGANTGLLPMGEVIGNELPRRHSLIFIFAIAFFIGFTATIAEPSVVVLSGEVQSLSNGGIPAIILTCVIAVGLGFFVALAMIRIIFGFPIIYILAFSYAVIIALSFFTQPELIPIAFDAGGFSTGLMTIPFAIALGIGLSSVLSKRTVIQEGFGVVGLACLGPVIGVMVMGAIIS